MKQIQILIVDLGSQYTLVIGRALRELGVRSIILSPRRAVKWLEGKKLKGVILSGGSASVYQEDAPFVPREILQLKIPILGICYGMQWLAWKLGGSVVRRRENKEYGAARVTFDRTDKLFSGLSRESIVWASHGDSVERLPKGFKGIAWSKGSRVIAAMSCPAKKIWAVQFHPEVVQTKNGKGILWRFLSDICGCEKDWKPEDIIEDIRKQVKNVIRNKKAIIGFSGGVDSSTLSAILSPVLKSNLLAVCIDTGALRKNEIKEIKENAKAAGVQLKVIRASRRFQKALGSTTNSETKRRRFKKLYGKILEEAAKNFGAKFILQASLATDIIESGRVGKADLIKSHHNIALKLKVQELHPFQGLFKYEVRALAEKMALPKTISRRQPFPGPGLFIRVVGKPPRPDKLSIVRWADAKVTEILKNHKLYNKFSQLIVGLECERTVGIKGDKRVYAFTAVVRCLITADFMTGIGYQIPKSVRREIASALTKHPKIVRVHFDETDKPPATTELE